MPPSDFYIKKSSGFSQEVDDNIISPLFYQPTPEGVKLLCAYYSAKHLINLRCLDLRNKVCRPDDSREFFLYLAKSNFIASLADNEMVGIVLSNGQNHAIPVLIKRHGNNSEIAVFDSTSGPRIKGYFRIASLFADSLFYLNSGTRQADGSSCITDAICVLKEALQVEGIFELINSKRDDSHPALQVKQSRFVKAQPKPDNFVVFKMPEQLLLTAQRTQYIAESGADTSVLLRGGKTLKEFRDIFQMRVSIMKDRQVKVTGINSYLFVKAREHKNIFDAYSRKLQAVQEAVVSSAESCEKLTKRSELARHFPFFLNERDKLIRSQLLAEVESFKFNKLQDKARALHDEKEDKGPHKDTRVKINL